MFLNKLCFLLSNFDFLLKKGLINLQIKKNFSSFGQFRISANLSNEIVIKNLVIDLISSLPSKLIKLKFV